MDLRGKKLVVIGGVGLIGSHTVDLLSKEDVGEIIVYDNFVRGTHENLTQALRDPRVKVFEIGGDVCQTDILDAALKDADGVFHFAALWLLQCHEFPRSAFDVNVRGTFNVIEACVANAVVYRHVFSGSANMLNRLPCRPRLNQLKSSYDKLDLRSQWCPYSIALWEKEVDIFA